MIIKYTLNLTQYDNYTAFYYAINFILSQGIIERRRSSSIFLSCSLLQFLMRWSLSKVKYLKQISLSERAQETATNERPAANSLSPISILVFDKVRP